ncbi:MAG: BON domain-containing protein [Humidesulfovibrio sp.]|nr:BON domain-containing protein [Humidesulfovibrio sp.]
MRRLILCLSCALAMSSLSGCGTIYRASVDERDVGTFVDDSRIESSVRARIINDPMVKLRDVSVNSYLGTVYLVGEFDADQQKMRAVRLAREVNGVRRVTIIPFQKRVDPTCGTTGDLALYAKIKKNLVEDQDIWSTQVDVKVVQCNVVVLGLVKSQHDADRIVAHANAVQGVYTVQNFIRIIQQ